MKQLIICLLFAISGSVLAQKLPLKGFILDEKSAPLSYVSVAILNPKDSTLAYFGITNDQGKFTISNVNQGDYLLQAAYLGYQTLYRKVSVPVGNEGDLGAMQLQPIATTLGETEVTGERIPIMFKKDSIEYDAAAFKTKPDAVVEDLLRKLPGVEVDKAGNIKAQGEIVKNVMVDGKEFFGSDPKIATKNLPADAIKKVQVFDKKSDESELTGVEDGTRDKTINLLLKDDKKSAWLGDLEAGGGTDEHYQASAKAYRFTKKNQFAVLGMLNNVNRFGFSFQDYIDFNGGIGSMLGGNSDFRLNFSDDGSLPVNFGQTEKGLISSGAIGLNYTYEKKKDKRFNISYLANGADKRLQEESYSQNFTPTESFLQNDSQQSFTRNRSHRINLGWRNRIDSTSNLFMSGSVSVNDGSGDRSRLVANLKADSLISELNGKSYNSSSSINADAHANYLKKWNGNWRVFKLSADAVANYSLAKNQWNNMTRLVPANETIKEEQYRDNQNDKLNLSLKASVTRKIGTGMYLEPGFAVRGFDQLYSRDQRYFPDAETKIDSLSPVFHNHYRSMMPSLRWRLNLKKTQLSVNMELETAKHTNYVESKPEQVNEFSYFTPSLSWDYEYRRSHRLRFSYNSFLNLPDAAQLLPVADNNNPLEVFYGNQLLRPEYMHDLRADWIIFDEFSFTSLFAGVSGTYTKDKINFSRDIQPDLSQQITMINVPYDYRGDVHADFSTPIRKLGVNFHFTLTESLNKGLNRVDGVDNIVNNYTHEFNLSVDNRKKNKWDISAGINLRINKVVYSGSAALDNTYSSYTYFAGLNYNPNQHWNFSFNADVSNYTARAFDKQVQIPLLKASLSRYILKSNRGVISLEVYDILNKNTGLERVSELNYLLQRRSNIIGRYAMLSFKYKLNKFAGNNQPAIQLDIRN